MNRRNWLSLARKLVDQYDLDYTQAAMQSALGQAALSYWGEGVLVTTTYPNPFPITQSMSVLGGSVGTGIAIDPNGQITEISGSPDEPVTFLCATADPTNARWDLLVLEYQMVGDTPVPKPSDPIVTIDLNLHDDFQLLVIDGTPSGSPAYPSKASNQIILAGLRVPAGATNGTQITVDLGIREVAMARLFQNPGLVHETPAGTVPGTTFTLSQTPLNAESLLLFLDGAVIPASQYTLTGETIVLTSSVAIGQILDAFYIYADPSSVNPLSGFQEVPTNTGDSRTFNLSGRVGNRQSFLAFINGAPIPGSAFSIVSGPSVDQVVLNSPLVPGQDLYAFYLINPASIGSGGGGGGGGVAGAANVGSGEGIYSTLAGSVLKFLSLVPGTGITITPDGAGGLVVASTGSSGGTEVHGSKASPVAINPAVGIVPTSAENQTWWIEPSSGTGAVSITESPAIAAGSSVGQVLKLKSFASANYLTIPDASGTDQNGVCDMGPYSQTIQYTWDGSTWSEDFRNV